LNSSSTIAPVIIVLGQHSILLARQIMTALPGATLYGLAERTAAAEVDVSFTEFGETLRSLFAQGVPIVGICAAGILIRTLAPMLADKRQEPPLLAVAEDGSAVVPLLGGLQGVNDLARQIAAVCGVAPAITTTGDIRFQTALLAPPDGYRLANPDDAKKFIADLLAGATVRLEGTAPWLSQSQLPFTKDGFTKDGSLTLRITEQAVSPSSDCLVYCPATLALGVSDEISQDSAAAIALVHQKLAAANLSAHAIAGVFALHQNATHPGIQAIASEFGIPARFFAEDLNAGTAEELALKAVGAAGRLVSSDAQCAIAIAPLPLKVSEIGKAQGRLAIVGTGPGSPKWMSPEAKEVLQSATDWVGYSTYLELVEPLRQQQQRHDSDNRVELDRARLALDLAAEGRSVALISSGDPGIYAMAAAVFEVLEQEAQSRWQAIDIQVVPGISALQAAAARIGAPIGHDFCAISLSDILKPWAVIEQRILAAAAADFVIAFYNPLSKQRTWQISAARDLLLRSRSPSTPVVLARDVGRIGESIVVRSLAQLTPDEVDMRTLVLVGSSKTRTISRSNGVSNAVWVYTPRRYDQEGLPDHSIDRTINSDSGSDPSSPSDGSVISI
jgi:cobalt-precorrin 5A hydrolase / precorrin-3B C17-methyltransferase